MIQITEIVVLVVVVVIVVVVQTWTVLQFQFIQRVATRHCNDECQSLTFIHNIITDNIYKNCIAINDKVHFKEN